MFVPPFNIKYLSLMCAKIDLMNVKNLLKKLLFIYVCSNIVSQEVSSLNNLSFLK